MAQRTYPSYWLYKDNRGEWRWSYDAKNGETIAVSAKVTTVVSMPNGVSIS